MAAALHVWKDKWEMASLEWLGQSRMFLLTSESPKPHPSPESPAHRSWKIGFGWYNILEREAIVHQSPRDPSLYSLNKGEQILDWGERAEQVISGPGKPLCPLEHLIMLLSITPLPFGL